MTFQDLRKQQLAKVRVLFRILAGFFCVCCSLAIVLLILTAFTEPFEFFLVYMFALLASGAYISGKITFTGYAPPRFSQVNGMFNQQMRLLTHSLALLCVSFVFLTNAIASTSLVLNLGDNEKAIIDSFGNAIQVVEHAGEEEFGMDTSKTFHYPGATLDFHLSAKGYYLYMLELTSSNYSYLHESLRVGADKQVVIDLLGPPSSISYINEYEALYYSIKGFDGRIMFKLNSDTIVSIFATEEWS